MLGDDHKNEKVGLVEGKNDDRQAIVAMSDEPLSVVVSPFIAGVNRARDRNGVSGTWSGHADPPRLKHLAQLKPVTDSKSDLGTLAAFGWRSASSMGSSRIIEELNKSPRAAAPRSPCAA